MKCKKGMKVRVKKEKNVDNDTWYCAYPTLDSNNGVGQSCNECEFFYGKVVTVIGVGKYHARLKIKNQPCAIEDFPIELLRSAYEWEDL